MIITSKSQSTFTLYVQLQIFFVSLIAHATPFFLSISHTLLLLFWIFSSGGPRMALKIIKNIDRYREAALSEVEVLEQMNSLDYDRK